jgi:hydrogenase expression/formation protein HypC
MCLAVPAKVIETDTHENTALVDLHGNRIRISTVLTPDASPGDFVLVHAGFSIQILDALTAQETFGILKEAGVGV